MSPGPFTRYPILFEDEALLLLDKPSGVLSHPNRGSDREEVAFEGKYDFEQKTFDTPGGMLWLLHRLDQGTSGVLLAAKDEKTARICRHAFEHRRVTKTYLAVVRGRPGMTAGEGKWQKWEDHLEESRGGDRVRVRSVRGKPTNAELRFRNVSYREDHRVSLLEIELITGRTHQIRVQCSSRQHPLAGDDIYGDFSWNRRLEREQGVARLQLHAWKLGIEGLPGKRKFKIEAPPPPDFWIHP